MEYSMITESGPFEPLFPMSSSALDNELEMEVSYDDFKDDYDHFKELEVQNLQKEISKYKQEIIHLDENEKMMYNLTESFEATITELISSREKQRVYADLEKERIVNGKAQIIEDLLSADNAYKGVKRKYDRTKEIIAQYKNDEDKLKHALQEKTEQLRSKQQQFERLKCHAEDKVNQANETIIQIKTNRDAEISKLTTMLRKSELRVETLEQTIKQKSEESRELANMCDELIGRA